MKSSKYLNQINEEIRLYKVNLINNNLIENYKRILKGENVKVIIKNQEQIIKKMNINNKKKNWTIVLLEQYNSTKNKEIGLNQLVLTLNKKGIL